MSFYDDYDNDRSKVEAKKKKQEKAKQRKVARYQEITEEEVRQQGSELLSKIVAAIPKHMNKSGIGRYSLSRKEGVIFKDNKLVVRISLALRPSMVVDYVVGAFKTKGWEAAHVFSDMEGYDFLDLTLPEDWLKRVLCIGRYNQKISDQPKDEIPVQPKDETPDRMRFLP